MTAPAIAFDIDGAWMLHMVAMVAPSRCVRIRGKSVRRCAGIGRLRESGQRRTEGIPLGMRSCRTVHITFVIACHGSPRIVDASAPPALVSPTLLRRMRMGILARAVPSLVCTLSRGRSQRPARPIMSISRSRPVAWIMLIHRR